MTGSWEKNKAFKDKTFKKGHKLSRESLQKAVMTRRRNRTAPSVMRDAFNRELGKMPAPLQMMVMKIFGITNPRVTMLDVVTMAMLSHGISGDGKMLMNALKVAFPELRQTQVQEHHHMTHEQFLENLARKQAEADGVEYVSSKVEIEEEEPEEVDYGQPLVESSGTSRH